MTNFKDDAYYDNLDKRTKEYKQWVAFKEQQIANQTKGVGDVIDSITEATGIKKIVKFIISRDRC
jgi:hypothetical protein